MKRLFAIALTLVTLPAFAMASSPFSIEITVDDGRPQTFFSSSASDILDQAEQSRLESNFPNYTNISPATAHINFRGLAMSLEFVADSTRLIFEVPSLETRETFEGVSRDASVEEFEEFMKSQGGDILNDIQKALIAQSPVDPIAGNPGSLMSTMVAGQFQNGFMDAASQIAPEAARPSDSEGYNPANLIHLGVQLGQYNASDLVTRAVTLPLGYSFRIGRGKGVQKVDLSLPVTLSEAEGAQSANVLLDLGLTYGVNDRWSLTPAAGVGFVGSADLGSAGGVNALSLTSAYALPYDTWTVNIGNMLGYYQTLAFEFEGYKFDPNVANTILRNGVMVSIPAKIGARDVAAEFWAIDTRFFGSELYSKYYNEFGVSIGLVKTENFSISNYLRAGLSYLTGDGVGGWRFNVGYSF